MKYLIAIMLIMAASPVSAQLIYGAPGGLYPQCQEVLTCTQGQCQTVRVCR